VDHFSKKTWSFLIPDKTAATITEKINLVLGSVNPPSVIQSDNGGEFVNKIVEQYISKYNEVHPACQKIEYIKSTPYHPQTNGAVEKFNGTLNKNLDAIIRDKKCKDSAGFHAYHTLFLQEYNGQPHSITKFAQNDIVGIKNPKIINLVNGRQLNAFKIDTDQQVAVGDIALIRDIFKVKGKRLHPVVARKRGKKGVFSIAVKVLNSKGGVCQIELLDEADKSRGR
jgi:hypothetical protein